MCFRYIWLKGAETAVVCWWLAAYCFPAGGGTPGTEGTFGPLLCARFRSKTWIEVSIKMIFFGSNKSILKKNEPL